MFGFSVPTRILVLGTFKLAVGDAAIEGISNLVCFVFFVYKPVTSWFFGKIFLVEKPPVALISWLRGLVRV